MQMKKTLTKIITTILTVTMCSVPTFAHSGRTDSSGGHHDYKNKSGLGSYHYHCGGKPPHLHQNGVCPYGNSSGSTSSKNSSYGSSSSSSSSYNNSTSSGKSYSSYTPSTYYVPSTSYNGYSSTSYNNTKKSASKKVYLSSYLGQVNGEPIQMFNIEGDSRYFIVAEDLADYGFDVKWVEDWNTLYISKNHKTPKKQTLSAPYSSMYLGEYKQSDYCLRLLGNNFNYEAEAYPMGGSILVPVTELKCYNIK